MKPPAPRLVGRDTEQDILTRALADVRIAGRAGVVEIVGEPGVGKTTLLQTLHAAPTGPLMLEGRAAEYERDLPFGVFVDALDGHLAGLDRHRVLRLGSELLVELAAVFPVLETFVDAPARVLDTERFRLYRAVRSLLERLAGGAGLVLVLDDLHWADEATCELIASLLRRPPEAAVLVALAYRTGRAPARLLPALGTAAAEGRLTRIELGPLGRSAAEELIASRVRGVAARERLYAQSGGNPFFIEQLSRVARGSGKALVRTTSGLTGSDIPPAVAEALAREVAALSAAGQTLLRAAAVAGEPFEPDVVAAVAGVSDSDGLVALDELLDCDLIRPTPVPRRFRFRHPLVRNAVYESTKSGWRLAAHARAAAALEARGASPLVCAPHVEHAASAGDEHAIALLAAAGAAAAGRAPGDSARWWQAALRLVPDRGAGSERRPELLPRVAEALAAAGRAEEAHALLLEALELTASADVRATVALVVACAGTENLLGRHEQALRRLLSARARIGSNTREAVLVELELATYGVLMNDMQLACDCARRALDSARARGDAVLQASAAALLCAAKTFSGEAAAAIAARGEAARVLAVLDDAALTERLELMFFLGWSEWGLGLIADSESRTVRAIELSRASGRAQWLIQLMLGRITCLTWMGRLDEALEVSEECIEATELIANPNMSMLSHANSCMALTARGEISKAVLAGDRALALARRTGLSQYTAAAGWSCSIALLESGAPQRAIDVVLELVGGPELDLCFLGGKALQYETLARAELDLGRLAEAQGWARRAATSAERTGLPFARAFADRAEAHVLLAAGDSHGAAVLAERSAAHALAVGARAESARANVLAARAHAGAGDRERAAELLRAAEVELAACGAQRYRLQAVRELRRIGRRVHVSAKRMPSARSGMASLSGREREVADRVRDHKSNREIAGELFLAEKTVESHLRSIFVKLGVDSRALVARAVERAAVRQS